MTHFERAHHILLHEIDPQGTRYGSVFEAIQAGAISITDWCQKLADERERPTPEKLVRPLIRKRTVRREYADAGMPPGMQRILDFLASEGEATVAELVDGAGLTRETISVYAGRLIKEGRVRVVTRLRGCRRLVYALASDWQVAA